MGRRKLVASNQTRGVTKQELASGSRKLTRAMHPKAKKKKNETAAQKASRKSYNKTRRKTVRKAGKGTQVMLKVKQESSYTKIQSIQLN